MLQADRLRNRHQSRKRFQVDDRSQPGSIRPQQVSVKQSPVEGTPVDVTPADQRKPPGRDPVDLAAQPNPRRGVHRIHGSVLPGGPVSLAISSSHSDNWDVPLAATVGGTVKGAAGIGIGVGGGVGVPIEEPTAARGAGTTAGTTAETFAGITAGTTAETAADVTGEFSGFPLRVGVFAVGFSGVAAVRAGVAAATGCGTANGFSR